MDAALVTVPAGDVLETCACPLCGADAAEGSRYEQPPFKVVRCGRCLLWYLSPRLEEQAMRARYASDAYFDAAEGADAAGYADYGAQEATLRMTFRRLLRHLDRIGATGGALLEVGCGFGFCLDEARDHFARRVGTELSPAGVAAARRHADDVRHGSIDAIDDAPAFDCAIALHVIEHVYDPIEFVRALARRLKPGGTMVLAAPDMGSFWRYAMGNRWPSFKLPEHVAFYDAGTLPRLLGQAGLVDPRRIPYIHEFPLAEILAKLGMPRPPLVSQIAVPLPATTVCYAARRSGAAS